MENQVTTEDGLILWNLRSWDELPVLSFAMVVDLSDSGVQEFLPIRLLHCLVPVHRVRIRLGHEGYRVLHLVLQAVIIFVHGVVVVCRLGSVDGAPVDALLLETFQRALSWRPKENIKHAILLARSSLVHCTFSYCCVTAK